LIFIIKTNMKKKFLTNQDRLDNLEKRGELIKESFQKEFDKIKRLNEERPKHARYGPDPTPEESELISKVVKDSGDREQARYDAIKKARFEKQSKIGVGEGETPIRQPEEEKDRPNLHVYQQNPNAEKQVSEIQYGGSSHITIEPKDDARCPDGQCQMYNVYYEGKELYEFSSISFRKQSFKEVVKQMFDVYNQSKYNMTLDIAVELTSEIFKVLGRSEEIVNFGGN